TTQQAPLPPTTALSTIIQDLLNFGSLFAFDNRLRTLEENFSEFMQTNQFAGAVSAIPGIVQRYMDQWMNEAVQVAIQLQSDKLHEEAQNDEFLKTIDENIRKEGKEPESASAPMETTTRSVGRSTQGTRSRQTLASESTTKPPTPDRDWNKTLPATHGSIQPWISKLAKRSDSRSSFNELMDTPLDFSNFLINRLKVDTLTPELIAGPTYELLKGSSKSLVELEYHLVEVYKATTNQLDWVSPEGASSRKYTTYVTKTKAVDYGHIKWIEDLVPRTMWIQEPIDYDKHDLWGVSHWGRKRQHFYGFTVNRESARNVYSKRRIIDVTELKIVERVKDLQLGVESYQRKLNLTKPDTYRSGLNRKEAYIAYSNPRGFIYQNKDKKNRLMRIDELHKFSDGTLTDVRTAPDDRQK
nr:hypothetical protein [Tanacetum cinerariifolium]